jgi:hypothetical protein
VARLRTLRDDRRVMRGLAGARHVVHVQPKRVTHTMREECRAHARREQRRLIGTGFEDPKPLEAPHECAVAQQLYRVPVQARSDRLEGGLEGARVRNANRRALVAHRLHLEDELVDRASLGREFTTIAHGHRARD